MNDSCFWKVKVSVKTEDDNGKIKKRSEEYLVTAISPSDAEVKMHDEFKDYPQDWEITNVSQTKIISVIK